MSDQLFPSPEDNRQLCSCTFPSQSILAARISLIRARFGHFCIETSAWYIRECKLGDIHTSQYRHCVSCHAWLIRAALRPSPSNLPRGLRRRMHNSWKSVDQNGLYHVDLVDASHQKIAMRYDCVK